MQPEYTTKQVAELLNVSESSVKRWCDRGLIEFQRTGGGHRRISRQSLASFLENSSRTAANGEPLQIRLKIFDGSPADATLTNHLAGQVDAALTDSWLKSHREKLFTSLLEGDEAGIRKLITQHFALRESVAVLADELLAPCFQDIGKSWVDGTTDIFQERRAVGITLQVLLEIRRTLPPVSGNWRALGCALAGDDYMLPTTIVEMVLRQNNIAANNLGTNLPFENLSNAVHVHNPSLVWLSVSHIDDVERFSGQLQDFLQGIPSDCTVLIGGRLIHKIPQDAEGRLHQFANMQDLERFVTAYHSSHPRFRFQ